MDDERQQVWLVDRLARSVPSYEPGPFFAARVARAAMERGARSVTDTIGLLARRLVPVLGGVSLLLLLGIMAARPTPLSQEAPAAQLNEIVLSGFEVGSYTLEDLLADRELDRERFDDSSK